MQSLEIAKVDFLHLAAIILKRHPANEILVIDETIFCWKIYSKNPITNHHQLIAFIHKHDRDENFSLVSDRNVHRHLRMDPAEVPTLSRRAQRLHSQEAESSGHPN